MVRDFVERLVLGMPKCKNQNIERIGLIVCFSIIFCCLYTFFRYVHPIVPWDGDDWDTVGLKCNPCVIPNTLFWESERMTCSFLGALAGHIAAFVVYPVVDDYVLSLIIVTAFLLSIVICASLIYVYIFMYKYVQSKLKAMLLLLFYIASAFLIFKSSDNCSYLYWHYNYCSVYFYCIPSYLAATLSLYFISKEIWDSKFEYNIKTACIISAVYFLIFSFLPAAVLLMIVSFVIIISKVVCMYKNGKKKGLKLLRSLMAELYVHFIVIFLFFIKLFFEIKKVFGTRYFEAPADSWASIKNSFGFLVSTFSTMNDFFVSVAFVLIVCFILCLFFNNNLSNKKTTIKLVCILATVLILCFLFFVLFGAVSIGHLSGYDNVIRLDTLYVFYNMLIILLTFLFACILVNNKYSIVFSLLIVIMMFSIIICPKNSYSDSIYMDTTPKQKYEIMTAIIDEVQKKDKFGESDLIVHMPRYSHYAGAGLGYALEISNIINKHVNITFVYEDDIQSIYFE